jgi:hypothetical protein
MNNILGKLGKDLVEKYGKDARITSIEVSPYLYNIIHTELVCNRRTTYGDIIKRICDIQFIDVNGNRITIKKDIEETKREALQKIDEVLSFIKNNNLDKDNFVQYFDRGVFDK